VQRSFDLENSLMRLVAEMMRLSSRELEMSVIDGSQLSYAMGIQEWLQRRGIKVIIALLSAKAKCCMCAVNCQNFRGPFALD
jgi:ABC-type tungstate transport system substrate-binding protein